MRHGEAYVKVYDELQATVREELSTAGMSTEDRELVEPATLIDGTIQGLNAAREKLSKEVGGAMFGGALKSFADLRARKRADQMTTDVDFSEPDAAFGLLTDDLPGKLQDELLSSFAMGYTFNSPENKNVPRDKDGFVRLCRDTDKDVIRVLVAQAKTDLQLFETMQMRFDSMAMFVTWQFNSANRGVNKYAVRDWLRKVIAMATIDTFIGGYKVRDLLEQEASFETMMKEL